MMICRSDLGRQTERREEETGVEEKVVEKQKKRWRRINYVGKRESPWIESERDRETERGGSGE